MQVKVGEVCSGMWEQESRLAEQRKQALAAQSMPEARASAGLASRADISAEQQHFVAACLRRSHQQLASQHHESHAITGDVCV